jgi:DNA polymerase III epsilon subunit-like protein
MTIPIFLDVETTGVGPDARIVSYALYREGAISHGLVSTPEEITNSHIHGITSVVSKEFGENIAVSLNRIKNYLRPWRTQPESDLLLVGHNIDFDTRIVNYEAQLLGQMVSWPPTFCTMKALQMHCKLPPKGAPGRNVPNGYKWPTLAEAYRWMFEREAVGLHCARTDMLACREIFLEGQRRGLWT